MDQKRTEKVRQCIQGRRLSAADKKDLRTGPEVRESAVKSVNRLKVRKLAETQAAKVRLPSQVGNSFYKKKNAVC